MSNKVLDDKYEIIHVIKQGGFGIVYYGIDRTLNKPIAIKEIVPNRLENAKYIHMFHKEALNIAKLSHQNIVHIYELITTPDGLLYIIMEYIDGTDLKKILKRTRNLHQKIPPHLTAYIIGELCVALDYAFHRIDTKTYKPLNLVHQDVTPSNIMISKYGIVKLIDFGIAVVRKQQSRKKGTHHIQGKIPYLAPEQLRKGYSPDPRSDIYSLGLVLYEALLGERLFNSLDDVLEAHKKSKSINMALNSKEIPLDLKNVLTKALEKDNSKRYQTANEMYIDLLQYVKSCDVKGELMEELSEYIKYLGML